MMDNITKVGIGVLVVKNYTNILLGRRKGSHGEGQWGLPGGKLEYGESFAETAYRELAEEVGPQFKVTHPIPISLINLIDYMPKHYIDVGMACVWVDGDPVVMEPDKCSDWAWFQIENLPPNLFATVQRIVNACFQNGPAFYDVDKAKQVV